MGHGFHSKLLVDQRVTLGDVPWPSIARFEYWDGTSFEHPSAEGEGPETLRSQCGVESQRRVVGVSCSCVPVVGFGSIRGPPIGWFDCGVMVSQCQKMTSPFADSSCWKIT